MESAGKQESMGYKDKEKALYTLRCLDGRDVSYQNRAINHYCTSAKKILRITKDEAKRKNIGEAIEIFEEWLRDYRENDRGKSNMPYLPIETIEAFRTLAESWGIFETEFYDAYKSVNGDYKRLRNVKVKEDDEDGATGVTWDIERNRRLRDFLKTIGTSDVKWYETRREGSIEYPTKEHIRCILLAYSPEASKLKALVPKISACNGEASADDKIATDEEPARERCAKRPREGVREERTSSDSDSSGDYSKSAKSRKRSTDTEDKEETSALGFKDREKALRSIESLEGRDISYQYHAISGLIKRAARVISCTKDEEKIRNMKEAVELLENWVTDYSANHRSRENFGYLSLDIVQACKPLADKYGIGVTGFVGAYEQVGGDYKKLRSLKVPGEDITWDIARNKRLRDRVNDIKERHVQWFETDEPMRGLPTKEHAECIMWGYSHEPAKLKKCLRLLSEKLT